MKRPDARSASDRVILEPGLPPLVRRGGGGWYTALRLPALHALSRGLPERRRSEGMLAGLVEEGDVEVGLATDDSWPSEMQLLNLRWLVHRDDELTSALLAALLGFYPRLRQTYDFLPDQDAQARLPDAVTEVVLRRLIRLGSLTIHAIPHASTPYLGAAFSCAWDDEHGLGVLTFGTEVLAVGTADVSQDRAAAQAHREAVLKALESQ